MPSQNDSCPVEGCAAPAKEVQQTTGNVLLQRSFNVKPKVRIRIGTNIFGHRGHIGVNNSRHQKAIPCRTPIFAAEYDPYQACPSSCPFWAEDSAGNTVTCRFQCVAASECGSLGRNATIADTSSMSCRTCMVPDCKKCVHMKSPGENVVEKPQDTTTAWLDWFMATSTVLPEEQCVRCADGYDLIEGRCRSQAAWVWQVTFVVFGLALLFCVVYYVHLLFRPIENMEGLQHGLQYRALTRLHKTFGHRQEDTGQLWPLSTNLCNENVGGPGLTLFFNFHGYIIVWSFVISIAWLLTAHVVSSDLLVIGTLPASTPQQQCSVIKWGHEYQHATMWVKVVFIFFTYLGTFFATMVHAILQLRRFQYMDDQTTMRDFAAFCSGIPMVGLASEDAEDELSHFIQDRTGEKVVGASICWSYGQEDETSRKVHALCNRDIAVLHHANGSFGDLTVRENDTENSFLTRMFKKVDWVLGFEALPESFPAAGTASEATGTASESGAASETTRAPRGRAERPVRGRSPEPLPKKWGPRSSSTESPENSGSASETISLAKLRDEAGLLNRLDTSGEAFIVFETELSRDVAIERMQNTSQVQVRGLFGDCNVQLQTIDYEPDTVLWDNCAWPRDRRHVVWRLFLGIFVIMVALTVWATCFYLPYAYYMLSFSYARGEMPGFLASTIFTLLVVAGNQIMYFLCNAVTNGIRFRCQDTFELTYMVLYTSACVVNLFFDLAITFHTTYVTMVAMQVHTYDGRNLEELSLFELFVSYPMQRALGHQLFNYAFPSCFLVPYILEPIFAIYLPLHIAKLVVRSNSDFRGYSAEQALEFFCPMDLSRYADILLNVCIAVTILLFPGGYVLQTFGILCASHIYMYVYDHYRVLREIPGLNLGTDTVDRCVSGLMAFPCCILLSWLIFKIHCLPGYEHVSTWTVLWQLMIWNTLHIIVHMLVLLFVVPRFGRKHHRSESTYAECAARTPCSWFNANTVHCLRSKYIYHHSPHIIPYVRGKEHLQVANPSLGTHYDGSESLALGATR